MVVNVKGERLQAVATNPAVLGKQGTGERNGMAREKFRSGQRCRKTIAVCLVGPSSLYVHGQCEAFELVIAGCLCNWLNHHQTPSSSTSHPFLFRRKPVVISELQLNLQIPTAKSSQETTPRCGVQRWNRGRGISCTATLVVEK